jgi:AMP-binding enzyme
MTAEKRVQPAVASAPASTPTLDHLFRRIVGRCPAAMALVDPPNRTDITDGAPKRLTWAEADRAVSAVAARLQELGLVPGTVVALQLPNIVENVVTLLGILRAGMVAAPLPLLWRTADAAAALACVGARALITCGRIGLTDHCEVAMHVAAETFSVRFVCAYGGDIDGVVALDDIFDTSASSSTVAQPAIAGASLALVTFDAAADGLLPIGRTHDELIAGGVAVVLEARLGRDAGILGALTLTSFPSLAATIVPWLMSGGALTLHQPFDPAVFAAQCGETCDVAVLPGPLIARLAEAGLLRDPKPRTVLAMWRAPERQSAAERWARTSSLIDVLAFGELGLAAVRRGGDGKARAIAPTPVTLPGDKPRAPVIVEFMRSTTGSLAMRGAMVPHTVYPATADQAARSRLKLLNEGWIDTGYACRVDATGRLTIDAPPPGVVSVGGYRFVLQELQDYVATVAEGSTLAALPDALAGQRLAGAAADRAMIRDALTAIGANALVVAAFGEGRADKASAA